MLIRCVYFSLWWISTWNREHRKIPDFVFQIIKLRGIRWFPKGETKRIPFQMARYTSGQACFQHSKSRTCCSSYNLHVFQAVRRDNIVMAVITARSHSSSWLPSSNRLNFTDDGETIAHTFTLSHRIANGSKMNDVDSGSLLWGNHLKTMQSMALDSYFSTVQTVFFKPI